MIDFIMYIGVFIISAIVAFLFEHTYSKKNLLANIMWLVLICILPLYIAFIRKGIGVDYNRYYALIELAQNVDSKVFFYFFPNMEIGNYALIILAKYIFGNIESVFCIYSCVTWVFIVSSILYYRDKISVPVAILISYMLLFPASLNIITQLLAVSIVIFALRFLIEGKYKKYILYVVISMFFHSSGIVGFLFFIYWRSYNKQNSKNRFLANIVNILILLLPVILIILFIYGKRLPMIGHYFIEYELMLNTDYILDIIWRLPIYLSIIYERRLFRNVNGENNLFLEITFIDFQFLIMSMVFNWSYRFSYYTIFSIIYLMAYRVKCDKAGLNRFFRAGLYVTYIAIIFFMLHVVWKRDGIVPFLR